MLHPFNTVSHCCGDPKPEIILLLLHNCNFVTLMNRNETHRLRTIGLVALTIFGQLLSLEVPYSVLHSTFSYDFVS